MTIVCITGMHRSGTSMVARVLNLAGLYLGPERDVLPANAANAEGYWENYHFVAANDGILSEFGGGWDHPPAFPSGWQADARMLAQRTAAMEFIRTFEGHQNWGWKDPRNSVTMEFWQNLLPDLKVVICLRNPLEVARSLTVRGAASPAFSLDLWLKYNRRLLDTVPVERRLITHYISYFQQPGLELARVLEFLGIYASEQQRESALEAVSVPLRHSHATVLDLLAAEPPFDLVQLYQEMCAEAGPAYQEAAADDPPVPTLSRASYDGLVQRYQQERQRQELAAKDQALALLTIQSQEETHALLLARDQLRAREGEVEALAAQVAERERQLKALVAQAAEREGQVKTLAAQAAAQVAAREAKVSALSAQLSAITGSRSWKVALVVRRIRGWLAPPGSIRAHLARDLTSPIRYAFVLRSRSRAARDAALIRKSSFFDAQWYLANNPDVAADGIDPAEHYLRFGGFELRDPGPNFSSRGYLEEYPDVKAAGVNPLLHYLRHGQQEGRAPGGPPGSSGKQSPSPAGRQGSIGRPSLEKRLLQSFAGGLGRVVDRLDQSSRSGPLHGLRVFLVPPTSRRAQVLRRLRDSVLDWVRSKQRQPLRGDFGLETWDWGEVWLDDESLRLISDLETG